MTAFIHVLAVLPALLTSAVPNGLSSASTARARLVLVPEASTVDACLVVERVAAVTALTPGVRLVRTRLAPGETLEAARAKLGADLAIDGTRTVKDGVEDVTLLVARAGTAPVTAREAGSIGIDHLARLVDRAWPKDAPPLLAFGGEAASPLAVEAACRGDAKTAYELSGDAIGRVLPALGLAPPPAQSSLAARWARATTLTKSGKPKPAADLLKGVVQSLAKNELLPLWRAPSAGNAWTLDLLGDTVVTFDRGAFRALDLASGLERWRLELGRAAPHLGAVGDGLGVAALDRELVAIELETGKVRWRAPLPSAFPELVPSADRVIAAGDSDVLALARATGEEAWRFDPKGDMLSGPLLVGDLVVVAAESFVIALDPKTGQVVKKTDLGDEISAPILATPRGLVWAMVGGDQVALVDPKTAEVKLRALDLPGVEWPPAIAGEQLALVAKKKNAARTLVYLDPAVKGGVRRVFPGASMPILALTDGTSIVHLEDRPPAVVARDGDGNVLWRVRPKVRPSDVVVTEQGVLVTSGTSVVLLDPKKGTVLASVELSEKARRAALGPKGGAILAESGAVYGLPSLADPRVARALRAARVELGRTLVAAGDLGLAAVTAKALLDVDPNDLDAQAIAAGADERAKPRDAAERWYRVALAAPRGDPLEKDAVRALGPLAGITGRFAAREPITDVAAGANVVAVRTASATIGLLVDPALAPAWEKRPPMPVRAAFDDLVLAGSELVRANDGAKVGALDPTGLVLLRGLALRVRASEATIARESDDGKVAWTRRIEGADLELLDATKRHVVVAARPNASTAKTSLTVLRTDDGGTVTTHTFDAGIDRAWISGGEALVASGAKLVLLDLDTGKELVTLQATATDVERARAIARGWLLTSKGKVQLVDRTTGRTTPAIALGADVKDLAIADVSIGAASLAVPPEVAILAIADGTLAAVDLTRGTLEGRLAIGPVTRLTSTGRTVVAIDAAGALVAIDPAKRLRR